MTLVGSIHLAAAILAMALGAVIVGIKKGTQLHRVLGYGYVLSMVVLNVTALLIYRLFGGFGVFHVLALISLVTLALGVVPAYRKRPRQGWIQYHYHFISWSYVGLLAAAVAEVAVRVPMFPGTWWHFSISAFVASFVVCCVGAYFIAAREKTTIATITEDPKTFSN